MIAWRSRSAPWVLYGLTVATLLLTGGLIVVRVPSDPGCPAFDCWDDGPALARFAASSLALPYAGLLAAGLGLSELRPDRWHRVRVGIAAAGLAVAVAAGVALLVISG